MIQGYLFYHSRIIYLLVAKLLQIALFWSRRSTKHELRNRSQIVLYWVKFQQFKEKVECGTCKKGWFFTCCIILPYGVMVPVLGVTSTKLTQFFPFLKHVRVPLGSIQNCSTSMETVLMSFCDCTATVLYHRKIVGEIVIASSACLFLFLFLNQNQSIKSILKESGRVTQRLKVWTFPMKRTSFPESI